MEEKEEKLAVLSDADMAEIKGGGRWIYIDGEWVWEEDPR